jgi:hypothetical protein
MGSQVAASSIGPHTDSGRLLASLAGEGSAVFSRLHRPGIEGITRWAS